MPILDKNGRPRSTRTDEEEENLLTQDIANLTEDEQIALFEILRKTYEEDQQPLTGLMKADYERVPVDVRTFLKDPYFLGHVGRSLWPQLVDDMVELFEGDYQEGVLGGSIGWGKSFFASTAMAYVIYQMSCLRNPQLAYGIDQGSKLYVAMLSVTEKVARRVSVAEFIGKVQYSPYFQENFPFKAAPSNLEIRFPKDIWVVAGSTGSSAIIGLNVFSGFIDETSFMGESKEVDRMGNSIAVDVGEQIHRSIIRRMKSRFQRVGRLPGVLLTVSSKERPSAFIEKHIQGAKEIGDPNFFVREYATWDVKPKEFFSSETFKVAAGTDKVQSRILTGEDPEEEAMCAEKGMHIIEVPVDYRDDFERDIDSALRDIAGIATEMVSPYMSRIDRLFDSVVDSLPVTVGADGESRFEWVANRMLTINWGNMVDEYERRLPGGYKEKAYRPKRHPGAVRYIHIDPSLSGDATGLVIAHVAGWTEVERRDSMGEEYNEIAPIIETDLILRIIPPPGDEILMSDVRSIVYQFQEHGFTISYVSMDSYQCLAKDTMVPTNRGTLPICEVEVGDLVMSRIGPREVENKWFFGEQSTLIIETQDGDTIEGTNKHRIEVQDGWGPYVESEYGYAPEPNWVWKRFDDIREGDVVRMCSAYGLRNENHALHGTKKQFGWRAVENSKLSTIDEWKFPEYVTDELSEWLGMVWGDGQIQGDGVRVTSNVEEASCTQDVFERLFGVRPEYRPVTDKHGTVSVSARWLVRWMTHNGMEKPLIPDVILRSDVHAKSAFLRGLFAADGSVSKHNGGVSFSTKHKKLAKQVMRMLRMDFDIESCLTEIERGHAGDYVESGYQYVVSVRGSRLKFWKRIGFAYRYKQGTLEENLHVRGRRKWARVRSISSSKSEVYDIQVVGDPSYVANGFMSHNSADAIQQLKRRGIEAEVVSVDRTNDAYETLKTAFYEGRIRLHDHPHMLCELRNLQRMPQGRGRVKVDHPSKMTGPEGNLIKGSKDVADSLAAVTFSLTQKMPGRPVSPTMGLTDATLAEKADHSWVSGGKIMIDSSPGKVAGSGSTTPSVVSQDTGKRVRRPLIKG